MGKIHLLIEFKKVYIWYHCMEGWCCLHIIMLVDRISINKDAHGQGMKSWCLAELSLCFGNLITQHYFGNPEADSEEHPPVDGHCRAITITISCNLGFILAHSFQRIDPSDTWVCRVLITSKMPLILPWLSSNQIRFQLQRVCADVVEAWDGAGLNFEELSPHHHHHHHSIPNQKWVSSFLLP